MSYFALFDDAQRAEARLLEQHVRSFLFPPERLHGLDAELQRGWADGLHACLCLPYEFGRDLHYPPADGCGTPAAVHWFARETLLGETALAQWLAEQAGSEPAGISRLESDTHETGYLKAVAGIQAAIARGEVYQINYTTRLHLETYGTPAALYRRLRERQPVPYGLLARLPGSPEWTLCFSPELFLRILPDGTVETEPMKGTAPLLGDGQDEARAQALRQDPKNRAENVMIVDLLRNDLGRIAVSGGVSVPEVFAVRPFGRVWQMTSLVRARPRPGTSAAALLAAAFPCGSITGAPKHMSIKKIGETETAPRGLYTGSIGYLKPCRGLGFHGTLNVAIRTLQLDPLPDGRHRGIFGVGSGIVTDSIPADEYRECGWKAGFLSSLPPEFGLIESLRAENGTCPLLPLHRRRLQASAAALRFPPPDDEIWQRVIQTAAEIGKPAAVRLEYRPDGSAAITVRPLAPQPPHDLIPAAETLPGHSFLRRFKTTRRAVYDRGWQQAEASGAFDCAFFNSRGQLLEGGRSSLFVRIDGTWHTPPLSLDILDGVMRRAVLADPQGYLNTGTVQESLLTRADLARAEDIRAANAVRGLLPVRWRETAESIHPDGQ